MKTNEIKKGTRVKLRNGWEAEMADNMRGNTRMAKVFGDFTEIGLVYSHDIMMVFNEDGSQSPVEHTPKQLELKQSVSAMMNWKRQLAKEIMSDFPRFGKFKVSNVNLTFERYQNPADKYSAVIVEDNGEPVGILQQEDIRSLIEFLEESLDG